MLTQYRSLSTEEWKEVINKLKDNDLSMFILRSLANGQQIGLYSIVSFNKEIIEGKINQHVYISQMTMAINSVLNEDFYYKTKSWYIWQESTSTWFLGYESYLNLKRAFKEVQL
jgi:hypothetical protein